MRIERTKACYFKHSVRLQHDIATETDLDSLGHPVENWQTYKTTKARIETLSGEELEVSRRICATATHRVTIRNTKQINASHRIQWRQRFLNVSFVNDVENVGKEQQILVTELV